MTGLAFLAVYICLASMLAQIPAVTSVALVLMAVHVAQAVLGRPRPVLILVLVLVLHLLRWLMA